MSDVFCFSTLGIEHGVFGHTIPKSIGGVMTLTPENKEHIDSLDYEMLLREWRFSPVGNPWFQGETGQYWGKRMKELRDNGADHVSISKGLG